LGGRISTSGRVDAGSAERNSLTNRARKNFATGPFGEQIGLPGMKGIFVASTPSRARRRQKGTRAAGHHFAIAGYRGSKC
jgi:hypothetical protein